MRLKHLLSVFLTLLTLSVGQMWGTKYTLTSAGTPTSASTDGFTFTFGKNSGNDPAWYDPYVRVYTGGYLTISHSSATITSIVYTIKQVQGGSGSNKAYPTGVTMSTGSASFSGTKGQDQSLTWTGSASSVTLTVNGSKGNYSVKDVTITYSSSYTVTWTINPAAGGSLSATSGTSTTVTPTSTYTYGNPAYSVTSGTASVLQNTNTFTATPSANCTIRINMVEKPKYTVTLKDDNSTITQTTINGSITLPSRTGCSGYTFAGWTKSWTSAQTDWTTTAPTIIPAGSYTPTANENLYPVYTKTEGGSGFTLSLIYSNSEYYIAPRSGSNTYFGATTDASNAETFYIEDDALYIYENSTKTYVSAADNNTSVDFSTSNPTGWTITNSSNVWTFQSKGTGTRHLAWNYNSGSPRFATYTGSDTYLYQYTRHSSSTTYYISEPNCCTALGSINGSVSLSQIANGDDKGKLQASWLAQEDKTGWATNGLVVKIYAEGNSTPVFTTADPISKDATSYTATTFDPDYCTTYYATLTPVKADNTYCEGVESTEHTSVTTKGQYTYSVVSATGVQLKSGENEEIDNCSDFSAIYEVTGTSQLNLTEVAVTNVASGGYNWNAVTGALTIDKTKVNGNVEITITGHAPSVPTVAATSVNFAAVDQGATVPSPTTFTITGEHLTGNLSMTSAQESDPFTWTITDGSLEKNAQDAVSATVTVTPKSGITDEAGTKQVSITISGGGASDVVVPISLTVQPRYTVSFSTGTGNDPIEPIKEETYDAGITLPSGLTPTCNDWTFVGWATAEVGSKTSTAPAQLFNGSYKPTEDITLYAVYSKAESGATEEAIASVSISAYASANSWSNGVQYSTVSIDANITATAAGGGNTGKYYTSGTNWRLYQGESATVTLSAANNCTLKSATFTYTNDNDGVLLDGATQVSSGSAREISGDSYTFSAGNTGSATNGQVRFTAISVTYDKPSTTTYYWSAPVCCTEKVTITKGENPANGTFTIDKDGNQSSCEAAVTVIVTPTPGEHCRVNTVSATTGETGVDNGDGTWTITYAQNTNAASTINVTFVTKTQYKVTWNVNGNESTKTDVYDGEQPVFPSEPSSCDDEGGSEAFYGWATAAWTGKKALNETGATIYTSANSMPAVTGAVTYYAVFAKATGGGSTPNEQIMNENSPLDPNSNWQDDQGRNNGIQSYAGKSSFQMYGETTNSYPCELTSKIKFNNITGISMNVAANNANTVYLYYSADGENWTTWENTVSVSTNTSSYTDYAFDLTEFPTGSYYICLSNSKSSLYMYSVTITSESEPEYSQFMTTCCTKHNVTIDSEIENGTVTASPASACEGATITLTFTPSPAYHLSEWTLGGVAQDLAENTFTMPDEAVTVSATFDHDPCKNLKAPTLNGDIVKTYNSATITWNAVVKTTGDLDVAENGVTGYLVNVIKEGAEDPIFNGNVNALTKALSELEAETQYNYSIMAVGDGTDYCATGNGVLEGNFTTDALPTAHLTLIDANGTHASSGDYAILTPFNLPDEAASCSKTFIGWDSDEDCTTAPDYAKGASFTFANTTGVTLYAVYADVTGGGTSTTNIAYSGSTTNMTGNNDAETFGLDADNWSLVGAKGNNSNYPGLNTAGDIRLYSASGGGATITITITAPQTITSVGLTFTGSSYNNAYVKVGGETVALSDGVYPINATSFEIGNANTSSTASQVRISNIAVNFTTSGTPSNYSTECAAAPEVIVDPEEIEATYEAVTAGVIEVDYDNVDETNIGVALYNDAECSEAFDGSWLTASLNGDKNIAYTIAENTSYNDARSAYIKLTAPAEASGPADAVVIIPVTQAKKPAVFASLAELAAADVASGTEVTVTLTNVPIVNIYTNGQDKRYGIYLNQKKANKEETPVEKYIEIYFNSEEVPYDTEDDDPAKNWGIGGKVSGTLTNCPWIYYYGDQIWELKPGEGWHWTDLTYNAPATVSSVTISGTTPDKTSYSVGDAFDPAGLTVHVEYSDESDADITASDDDWAYVTWNIDPATFAAEHIGTDKSVSATATYSGVSSTATEISGLTVNKVAVTGVTLNQNAATLKVGKTVTLTATVEPANATYKGIEWSTSDGSVATVENGVVTAVAAGTATITVTATDDNTKTATCAITVLDAINFAAGDWTLVTDAAELTAGSYVIIAAKDFNYAMKSYEDGNNCGSEAATKSSDMLHYDEDFGIFEIGDYEISAVTYKTFQDAETDQYLYISTNNNRLQAQDTKNENAAWTITSVSNTGVAVVTSKSQSSRTIRYNNNSDLFACYTSGQADIALYKYYAPVPKVTYNKNTEDEVTGLPAIQKTVWETDAYKATVAAGPSRTGYTFTGWNSAAEGNGIAYAAGTKYSFAADITLYAQWNALPKYTVTYTANGGTGTAPAVEEYLEGATVTVKANSYFSKPGFVYAGWQVVYNDGEEKTITPNEDGEFEMVAYNVTIKALWEEPSNQKWVRVESTDELDTENGTNYIIVGASSDVAMGAKGSGNFYTSVGIVKTGNYLNGPESMTKVTLEAGSGEGKFAIKHGTKYIYSESAKNIGEQDATSDWTITIADGVASIKTGTGDGWYLKYNSKDPRFNTYASGQQAVAIYREKALTPIDHDGMTEDDVNTYDDVEIAQNKTWTVSGEIEVGDVYMKEGAVIANSAEVTANDLYFKTKKGKSNQIVDASQLNVIGDLYYDVQLCDGDLDADYWYSIAVPFDVDLNSGVFQADGSPMTNRVDFEVWGYDTQLRAQTQSNGWKRVNDNMMHAGKAYLIGFNSGQTNTIRLKAAPGWKQSLFSGNSMSVVNSGSGDHDNWNGLANPMMRYIDVNKKTEVFNNNTHEWDSYDPEALSFNFVVGTAFFVQSDEAVTISNTDHGNYRAPKRESENKCAYAVRITREDAKDFDNQIIVRASEEATGEYTQGHDMLTMNGTSSNTAAMLWTENYGGKRLAIEEAAWLNGTASYVLKMFAPKAGSYSISVAETKDNADLYLTYEGSIIWNLSMGEYTVDLSKGKTDGYGLLLQKKAPQTPTGVEQSEVSHQPSDIQKIIINDNVFILRGGQMYDVTGKAVK